MTKLFDSDKTDGNVEGGSLLNLRMCRVGLLGNSEANFLKTTNSVIVQKTPLTKLHADSDIAFATTIEESTPYKPHTFGSLVHKLVRSKSSKSGKSRREAILSQA